MPIHIGTSGWSYAHWDGVLYPRGLGPRQRLAHYAAHFQTAELNASYYRWPREGSFTYWRRALPKGFLLSVKAPRLLTHVRRLYGPERWIQRIERGLDALGPRRAVLLVQLPPTLAVDYPRLEYFLRLAPRDVAVAVEFRHPSWQEEGIFQLLEHYRVAYCVMSGAGLPCVLRATAGFVYVRLHGPDSQYLYAGSYSDAELSWWAQRAREWERQGRDVFLYFNNDGAGHAVRNAWALRRLLGQ